MKIFLYTLLLITSISCQSNLQAATFADTLGELGTSIKNLTSHTIDCGLSTGAIVAIAAAITSKKKNSISTARNWTELAAGLFGILLLKKAWNDNEKITKQNIPFYTGVALFWGSIADAIIHNN